VAAIALGGGPNGTLVAAITTNEELPRLRFLDRTSLSELSSSPLRGCEHPNCDARELAITSIDGVVAVRGEFDIPDGRASHWALVRACGD
jgi:hypothetical protein